MLNDIVARDGVLAKAFCRLMHVFFESWFAILIKRAAPIRSSCRSGIYPSRKIGLSRLAMLVLLAGSASWSTLARANECPTLSATVVSGGNVTIDVSCSPEGATNVSTPSHGTAVSTGESDTIIYTNNGTGTTDQFTFLDDENETITVNITIGTPTYPAITISPTSVPSDTVGTAYSQTFTASGGDGGPYTYNISTGNLPAGLNFSGNTISGTPTESGSFAFTVTAEDSHSDIGPQAYTLVINGGVLSVSPATAPSGNLYAPYSLTMSASGGTAPYTYSYGNTGSLPPGVNFNNGVFSGTPSQIGTFTYAVNAADSAGNSERVDYTFVINPPDITLSPTSLPDAKQYVAYSQPLTASGGAPGGYTFSLSSGALPAGLTLSSSGVLSGTINTAGSYNFVVRATDSSPSPGPYSGTQSYTFKVDPNVPTISTASLPAGTVGTAYSQTITATSGVPPYTFSVSAGGIPGLTLSSGGVLSGTPTAGGGSSITVKVTDSENNSATQTYTPNMGVPSITLSPANVPAATLHAAYSQAVTAQGGTAPYTYALATGSSLPPGLNLSNGVITGSPTSSGSYTFSIVATDSSGGTGPYTGTISYTVNVSAPNVVLSPASLTNEQVGLPSSQTITASGGSAPYTYTVSAGALPPGISLSSSGVLSGTPTSGGSFSFTVTATDSNTNTGSQAYTVTVSNASITISPASLNAITDGVAFSQTITASGGTSPYSYSLVSGSLPPGISLASNGALSGTPTGAGPYSFTVQAQDSSTGSGAPYTTTRVYSVTVGVPTINVAPAGTTLNTAYGHAYSQTFSASGGTGPYTFTETGTLPNGVSWNAATATLSGTPTQSGNFPFTVSATDHSTGSGPFTSSAQSYTLVVSAGTITIAPSSLPSGTVGVSYPATQFTASGGIANYTYSYSGNLPAGLSLSSSGALSGTPTAAGSFSFTVTTTDSNGVTGTQSYTINAAVATPVLSPASLPAANAETAYSQTFSTAGGTAPYQYTISAGALPTGLTLNGATGVLSGTANAAGTFSFTVKSTDSSTGTNAPFTATHTYTVNVNAPAISITPASLANEQVAASVTQTLTASGGNGSYTFTISAGALPTGLSLSPAGTLTGTPTATGTFNFTVTVTDGLGFTGSQAYTVMVNAPNVVVNPATLPAASAETAYSQSIIASGGTAPYTYAISSGALPPGLSLNTTTGSLSGTPTAAGSFSFSVRATDSSSGTGAPFSATRTYTLTVNVPSIAISPSALPGAQVAAAYSQQLTASGGNGSYSYTITAGALPTGVALSTAGLLSGTPTAAGTYSFTITAKDSLNFSGSQSYSISTQQPKPIAVNDTATTSSNQAVTINVTSVDTGPITGIAIGTAPTHGTVTLSGVAIVYTPTHDFFGTDTLTYTATGPGGTSAPATVTITVTPLAVPTVAAQTATVVGGNAVTINAANGATGGPFTAVTIVKAPATGTASVSGTSITYSAAQSASGQVSFTYTLSNAFGASLPATVTVTVDPRPIITSQNVTSVAGRSVQVNLTQGAAGGPFTAATLVGISPATAGRVSIAQASGGYMLDFTSSPTFSGVATVTFTLSNAYATSNPGTIAIAVASRPDPSKDAQVLGVLGAEADAAREFAQGQIENFQQRMESLHGGGGGDGGFQNGLTFMSDSDEPIGSSSTSLLGNGQQNTPDALNRRYLQQPQTPANPTATSTSVLPNGYAVWTGGAVNFGSRDTTASASGFDFTTAGISAGVDKRISSSFALGAGVGYGHDDTSVGNDGSHVNADSYNLALYGSFSPSQSTFIDGLVGYQWLSFDARRFVTTDGNTVNGHRNGDQVFASLSAGYEYRTDTMLVSPYGRIDDASAHLNGYTEQGDDIYALSYQNQTVRTTTGSLGVRANYLIKEDYGTVMPQIRVEYEHDFQGSSQATMSYADLLAGPIYRAQVDPLTQNHFLIGIGVNWQFNNHWLLRLEYENMINAGDQNDQSILINVQKKF
jgi:outer membrane autotransporter protein